MENDLKEQLTDKEKLFCELFVNGVAPFCGNESKCYGEVFGVISKTFARKLLSEKHIKHYIAELEDIDYEESKFLKKRLTETLLKIVEETSEGVYYGKKGIKLSPAPLRSVAVQATKALMDMHPIKEANINKLNIEGSGDGGVVFNVIVPTQEKKDSDVDENKSV